MLPRKFSSEAVVLKRKNFGEADRILFLYTKNFGKLEVLAKGVRKPTSRKRGHIEVFSQVKFSANKSKGISLMTEVQIIRSFAELKSDLKRLAVGYFVLETILKLTNFEEKNQKLYLLLLDTLKTLTSTSRLKSLRKDFIYKVLVILGFWPEGKSMEKPDEILSEILEREITSIRVGKRLLQERSVVE